MTRNEEERMGPVLMCEVAVGKMPWKPERSTGRESSCCGSQFIAATAHVPPSAAISWCGKPGMHSLPCHTSARHTTRFQTHHSGGCGALPPAGWAAHRCRLRAAWWRGTWCQTQQPGWKARVCVAKLLRSDREENASSAGAKLTWQVKLAE